MNQVAAVEKQRSPFLCGADCTARFLCRRDNRGAYVDVFAVVISGRKFYLEMMQLKPRDYTATRKYSWVFGDIKDAITNKLVWGFSSHAKPTGFKGDVFTEKGADNRTYVVFQSKRGDPDRRVLLSGLLGVAQPVVLPAASVVVTEPEVVTAPAAPETIPVAEVLAAPVEVVDEKPPVYRTCSIGDYEHGRFFADVLWKMCRSKFTARTLG